MRLCQHVQLGHRAVTTASLVLGISETPEFKQNDPTEGIMFIQPYTVKESIQCRHWILPSELLLACPGASDMLPIDF